MPNLVTLIRLLCLPVFVWLLFGLPSRQAAAWLLGNLRAGRPEVWQAQSEEFTPHMLNLDRIDAISFDKGCYPGQEIVARTYYRGATKRRCQRFESDKPLAPGDKVSDGSRDLGEVVNAAGTALLAVVPVDADRDALSAGDIRLRPMPLPYSLD